MKIKELNEFSITSTRLKHPNDRAEQNVPDPASKRKSVKKGAEISQCFNRNKKPFPHVSVIGRQGPAQPKIMASLEQTSTLAPNEREIFETHVLAMKHEPFGYLADTCIQRSNDGNYIDEYMHGLWEGRKIWRHITLTEVNITSIKKPTHSEHLTTPELRFTEFSEQISQLFIPEFRPPQPKISKPFSANSYCEASKRDARSEPSNLGSSDHPTYASHPENICVDFTALEASLNDSIKIIEKLRLTIRQSFSKVDYFLHRSKLKEDQR